MTSIFIEERVTNLLRYINNDNEKLVIFTNFCEEDQILRVCLSNGFDVFVKEIDEDVLEVLVEEAECTDKETFLSLLRSCFSCVDVKTTEIGERYLVRFQTSPLPFLLTLCPTTAAQRKDMFRYIFFELADKLEKTATQILELQSRITTDHSPEPLADHMSGVAASTSEPERKRSKQTLQTRPRVGGSIINPGSRRRKPATGVVFD